MLLSSLVALVWTTSSVSAEGLPDFSKRHFGYRPRWSQAQPKPIVSSFGRCGEYWGTQLTCSGSRFGGCCSSFGRCGSGAEYCGKGCNSKLGTCTTTQPKPNPQPKPPVQKKCPNLIIDDFSDPSRLNFLGYNSLFQASSGSGTLEKLEIKYSTNLLEITPKASGFFFTNVPCGDYSQYDELSFTVKMPAGADFNIVLQSTSSCSSSTSIDTIVNSKDVIATSDGSTITVRVPFSKFQGANIKGLKSYVFGPVRFSCAGNVLQPIVPETAKIFPSGKTSPEIVKCTVPNAVAFGIDDGAPDLAQQTMQILKDEGVKATFFILGLPLNDKSTNFTNIYKEARANGHQIASHSWTHPSLDTVPDSEVSLQIDKGRDNVKKFVGVNSTYFRAPFGPQLQSQLGARDMKLIKWDIDIEDYLWGTSDTPRKQLDAFKRDVDNGGSLVVMHYLYPSTVDVLREMIQYARAKGKKIMRVDQCLGDKNAPRVN